MTIKTKQNVEELWFHTEVFVSLCHYLEKFCAPQGVMRTDHVLRSLQTRLIFSINTPMQASLLLAKSFQALKRVGALFIVAF